MEIKKSCENCVHNVSPMCTGKACGICDATSLKLWRPDYQTLESELQQYKEAVNILAGFNNCPPEKEISQCNYSSRNSGDYNKEICRKCRVNWALTKAKGG
jgi:hypothetical protein